MRRRGPRSAPGVGTQVNVDFLERAEKPNERAVQVGGTAACLAKIAGAELVGERDRGRPQRTVLVGSLGPRNPMVLVDPERESHNLSIARGPTY